jgi:hypothetical protein
MTQLYRVVAYVLNLNGDQNSKEDVIDTLEHNKYPEFLSVEEIQETDCGEWDDDHPLNLSGADYASYFPELKSDETTLKKHFQVARAQLMEQKKKNATLEDEIEDLKNELKKLQEVKKFVSNIKEIMK